MRERLILLFLISFGTVAAVLYTPALPEISKIFGIGPGKAQQSVTLYLIGYAVGQLIYGPISAACGRRRTIIIGCLIAILGSTLCLFAPSFSLFLVGRFVTSLGCACGMVVSFIIIGDLYGTREARHIVSVVLLVFGIVTGVAPLIGGFLTLLSWHACFLFLIGYSLFLLMLATMLPQTLFDRKALNLLDIAHRYREQGKGPRLLLGGLTLGLNSVFLYVFSSEAPFIAVNTLQLTPDRYGLWGMTPYAGIILASWASTIAPLCNLPATTVNLVGIVFMTSGALVQLIAFFLGAIWLWSLLIPVGMCYFGMTIQYVAISSYITAKMTDRPSASAMMTFYSLAIPTLFVLALGLFFPREPTMMSLLFLAASLFMIPLHFRLKQIETRG